MNKRFTIALNPSSPESEKVFKDFLKSRGWGWWHWIENYWIIEVTDNQYTAEKVYQDLTRIFPEIRCLIIGLPTNVEWFGQGPHTDKSSMFQWLTHLTPDSKETLPPPRKTAPPTLDVQ